MIFVFAMASVLVPIALVILITQIGPIIRHGARKATLDFAAICVLILSSLTILLGKSQFSFDLPDWAFFSLSVLDSLSAAALVLLAIRRRRRWDTLQWPEDMDAAVFQRAGKSYFAAKDWFVTAPRDPRVAFAIKKAQLNFSVVFVGADLQRSGQSERIATFIRNTGQELKKIFGFPVLFIGDFQPDAELVAFFARERLIFMHFAELPSLEDVVNFDPARSGSLPPSALAILRESDTSCLALAKTLWDRGARAPAIEWAEHSVRAKPDNGDTHFRLSLYLTVEKQLDRALEHALSAYNLSPKRRIFILHLIDVYDRSRNLPVALEWAEKAMELHPGQAIVLDRLASLLLQQGNYDRAETASRQAVSLEPGNAKYGTHLAEILRKRGAGVDPRTTFAAPDQASPSQ